MYQPPINRNKLHGAYILARYSTDNQDADSIDVQVDRCRRYADQNHIPVLGVYADYAVSGMKDSRPQERRMLEDLRTGGADTVLIYDQSRGFRNMPRWFDLREELNLLQVRIISVTQPMLGGDLNDPGVFISEAAAAMCNHLLVLQTKQKTKEKLHWMARQGKHTGGVPALGYRVEDGRLVIDEQEAAVVRRIFSEYASGRSYKQIMDALNRDGITTKRGQPFGANSIHCLLKNEKYIGTLIYGALVYRPDGTRNNAKPEGTDIVHLEDAIPAIIDKETFQEVQQRMTHNKRAQAGRPSSRRPYPLRGKVFCGECGSAMTVTISKGSNTYYNCAAKKRLHNCTSRPIRADVLEGICIDYVTALIGNPDIQRDTLARIQDHIAASNASAVSRLQSLLDEQRTTSAMISNLVDAIAKGLYSPTVQQRLQYLEEQSADISLRIANIQRTLELSKLPSSRLQDLFDQVVTGSKQDPTSVLSIVSRVEVSPEEIRIYTALDPDPTKHPIPTTTPQDEVITIDGTPSGVPTIIITTQGIGLIVRR